MYRPAGNNGSVLIGASKPQQIIENISIVHSAKFTQEELKKIEEIYKG